MTKDPSRLLSLAILVDEAAKARREAIRAHNSAKQAFQRELSLLRGTRQ